MYRTSRPIQRPFGRNFLAYLFALCITAQASAQLVEPSDDALRELDGTISQYLEENVTPGAVVAVIADGQLVHVRPYGLANVELSVPVTEDTVFEIGSISKQFVAAAAMILVGENKLDLDKPIHHYLPEVHWKGLVWYCVFQQYPGPWPVP